MEAKRRVIVCSILSIVFVLFSFGLGFDAWNLYDAGKRSLRFKSCDGLVRDWTFYRSRGTRTPVIHYVYELESKRFESRTVRYGYTFDRDVQSYPKGMKVKVFYDPEHPVDACLEPGKLDEGELWFKIIAVLVLTTLSLFLGFFAVRLAKSSQANS